MSITVRIDFIIPDYRKNKLITQAIICGYTRVEPRKPWTLKEEKEAIRFLIEKLIQPSLS